MINEAADIRLVVVIPDFNGWQQTQTCLQHLAASSYTEFETIVVDHGTTGTTAEGLVDWPSCQHVQADPELWWSGATNVGIREAIARGASHIMLLNNDCYVDETTIGELVELSASGAKQLLAPLQRDAASGEMLVVRAATCFTLGFPTIELPYMRRVPAGSDRKLATRMIVGGRGVIVPVDVFNELGLFDEKALPHYAADHDFFMRCRKRNIALFVATRAAVAIDNTRTTVARDLGRMSWAQFRNSLRNPRSHRNVNTLATLFKRHYPIRPLYFFGVSLNVARYFLHYVLARLQAR